MDVAWGQPQLGVHGEEAVDVQQSHTVLPQRPGDVLRDSVCGRLIELGIDGGMEENNFEEYEI